VDPLLLAVVIGLAALAASIMGGIAGIGTAIAMIPVLTFAFGIREAIPIITVAMLLNNGSRWWANRAYIDYRVVGFFVLGAVPTSVLGGAVFANAPADLLARGLGIFLLALVVYHHLPIGGELQMTARGFVLVGLVQGFLSSIFGGAGPFGAHFFMAYGLYRNAFIGTVAVATTAINITKGTVYGGYALIELRGIGIALAIGLIMVVGAAIGGRLVRHVPDRAFAYIVEAVMVTAGLTLLLRG
jgi:uncharacterized membrane protein YfcA